MSVIQIFVFGLLSPWFSTLDKIITPIYSGLESKHKDGCRSRRSADTDFNPSGNLNLPYAKYEIFNLDDLENDECIPFGLKRRILVKLPREGFTCFLYKKPCTSFSFVHFIFEAIFFRKR